MQIAAYWWSCPKFNNRFITHLKEMICWLKPMALQLPWTTAAWKKCWIFEPSIFWNDVGVKLSLLSLNLTLCTNFISPIRPDRPENMFCCYLKVAIPVSRWGENHLFSMSALSTVWNVVWQYVLTAYIFVLPVVCDICPFISLSALAIPSEAAKHWE